MVNYVLFFCYNFTCTFNPQLDLPQLALPIPLACKTHNLNFQILYYQNETSKLASTIYLIRDQNQNFVLFHTSTLISGVLHYFPSSCHVQVIGTHFLLLYTTNCVTVLDLPYLVLPPSSLSTIKFDQPFVSEGQTANLYRRYNSPRTNHYNVHRDSNSNILI